MQGINEAQPTPAAAALISAVLGNDDLLREILLRLGFPTTLVLAALVSKRWLRTVSDPAFLRHFRKRHPPHLLGFYFKNTNYHPLQFVPASRTPELATAVRRARVVDGNINNYIRDSRHGRLLVSDAEYPGRSSYQLSVLSPLQPPRTQAMTPPSPRMNCGSRDFYFFPEDGREDGAIAVEALSSGRNFIAEVSTLQSGVWSARAVAEIELLDPSGYVTDILPPVSGKVYMRTSTDCLLELNLVTMNISVLQLPDRVRTGGNFKLSCRQDLGLFLIHAEGALFTVWHNEKGSNGKCNWKLVDGPVRVHEAWNRGKDVEVLGVDVNHEYVFLALKDPLVLISVHMTSRTEKVYDNMEFHYMDSVKISPFMMIWPPIFPALSDENNQKGHLL